MNEALFEELLESVREGAAIFQGKKPPSRQFEIEQPDVKSIYEQNKITQVGRCGLKNPQLLLKSAFKRTKE